MLKKWLKGLLPKSKPVADDPLSQYLHKLSCACCHNHCALDRIKCGGGLDGRKKAIAMFERMQNKQ